METKNNVALVASAPNVGGNISSCETKTSGVEAGRPSLFYVNTVNYATNNCTGKTDVYNSWDLSGFSIGIMIIVGLILFGMISFWDSY